MEQRSSILPITNTSTWLVPHLSNRPRHCQCPGEAHTSLGSMPMKRCPLASRRLSSFSCISISDDFCHWNPVNPVPFSNLTRSWLVDVDLYQPDTGTWPQCKASWPKLITLPSAQASHTFAMRFRRPQGNIGCGIPKVLTLWKRQSNPSRRQQRRIVRKKSSSFNSPKAYSWLLIGPLISPYPSEQDKGWWQNMTRRIATSPRGWSWWRRRRRRRQRKVIIITRPRHEMINHDDSDDNDMHHHLDSECGGCSTTAESSSKELVTVPSPPPQTTTLHSLSAITSLEREMVSLHIKHTPLSRSRLKKNGMLS